MGKLMTCHGILMDSPWDFGVYCQLKLHQVAAAAASAASVACFEALQKETGWDHPICWDGNTKHTALSNKQLIPTYIYQHITTRYISHVGTTRQQQETVVSMRSPSFPSSSIVQTFNSSACESARGGLRCVTG